MNTDTKNTDIMLDLETMSTRPDAAIVAIGAVAFGEDGIGARFYVPVSLETSVARGGVIDAGTVLWWMRQSDEARDLFRGSSCDILEALERFATFINDYTLGSKDVCVWGNGVDFDNVILASAYVRAGLKMPWRYHHNRCYRTIKGSYPTITADPFVGVKHNALADADNQAQHMLKILKILRSTRS